MPGYFQGRIAVVALQRTFPGNYIYGTSKALDLPLVSTDRDPPCIPRPALARLRGIVSDANYGINNKQASTAEDTTLPRPSTPSTDAC